MAYIRELGGNPVMSQVFGLLATWCLMGFVAGNNSPYNVL